MFPFFFLQISVPFNYYQCSLRKVSNSFNEIIDKILIFSDIDKIFVKLLKKPNYLRFGIDNLKEGDYSVAKIKLKSANKLYCYSLF